MVQMTKSRNIRPESGTTPCREKVPVKDEIKEDFLEEEFGPHNKRSKPSSTFQQCGTGTNAFPIPPSQYNPLDEPSPLGLRLRKSPSLLDLIQMKLTQSQGHASTLGTVKDCSLGLKKEGKSSAAGSIDKLKASNFPASLLKIGGWEYASRYEGDLVAKCYFAKHKLVWEVLDGGLKNKIEIQWSDVMDITANYPDNGPGTLKVVLARQPLFFRETNPQPRKHTLWQATADFTDGQASRHRLHFLQCPQGMLNKHFEKLIQCDMRLNFLSQQPEMVTESPYFESRASIFTELGESKSHGDQLHIGSRSTNSEFYDVASPHLTQSSSLKTEHRDPITRVSEHSSRQAPSPSSVMDTCAIEGNLTGEVDSHKGLRSRNWERLKGSGLHPSMSVNDLVSHIEHCISEQITTGNPTIDEGLECKDVLEDIAHYLLSDSQFTSTTSDEKTIMSRVNSLCCLLQKDPSTVQNSHTTGEERISFQPNYALESMYRGGPLNTEGGSKGVSGMSRKDSFSELLLHLPRIASLPKFLFNIPENS